jgi:hypothetical protein
MENTEKQCLECGKTLKGRLDKKYCDDYCRNNYNNRQNSDQTNFVRNVNNILRKNRRILQGFLEDVTEAFVKIKQDKLVEKGFQFSYHTHTLLTQKGQTYTFCYEYGYLILDAGWVLVVKSKEENAHH